MKKEEREDPQKNRSKRKYPPKECINPYCEYGFVFSPHDRRQNFCCTQCRVNYYNDLRHFRSNSIYSNEKLLKVFDKKLGEIYSACVNKDGYCVAWIGLLEYEKIDVRLQIADQRNPDTKGNVKWLYQYGTEIHPTDKRFIIIHKKETK